MTTAETARLAAQTAGDVLMTHFQQGVSVRHKGAVDLVSDADLEAERVIASVIRDAFPDHSILGEERESGDVSAEHLWVIDPLDGTTNFTHDIPHFAVSIAFFENGRAQDAVVFNPARSDWFTASRGQGAFHNGHPMRVSDADSMNDVLVGVGFYYDRGAMMQATLRAVEQCFRQGIHGLRRMGTASLDLALVAAGCLGAFFEYELSPWDFAAGALLVEEAGGRISTCQGHPLPLQKTSVLASNGRLHDAMLAVTQTHHP